MVSEWFYIALITPLIWALVVLIDDNLLRKIYKSPIFAAIISGLLGLLPVLTLFFIDINIPSIRIISFAILSGFLITITSLFYFKSLQKELPSVTLALWNIGPALVPFFAYLFLGEILNLSQYMGFAIILGSSMGLSVIDIKKFKFSGALYLMLFAAIFTATIAILQKYVYNFIDFWSGFIFVSIGMGVGGLFLIIFFKEGRKFPKQLNLSFKKWIWIFLITELLNVFAVLFSNLAISKGPVSLVKVVEGILPIYLLIFAILFYPIFPKYLREATHGKKIKKILFMVLMLIGLYLINF